MEDPPAITARDRRYEQGEEPPSRSGTTTLHSRSRSRSGCRSRCWSSLADPRLSDRLVHKIFLLLGVGILIPWNAFVSAKPYFTARLCQSGSDVVNFEQWFGLVYNLSSVCSLGLIILGQSFLDYWQKTNPGTTPIDAEDRSHGSSVDDGGPGGRKNRDGSFYNVVIPLVLCISVFFGQAVLVAIPGISPVRFFVATILGLAVCGISTAIATAGIVATAGSFPARIGMNPFFSGQALGGAAVSVANLVDIALGEDPDEYREKHCAPANNETLGTSLVLTDDRDVSGYEYDYDYDYVSASTATQRSLSNALIGEGNECSPYQHFDRAVAMYFVSGCIVLVLCLVGFFKISRFETNNARYGDDYAMVEDRDRTHDDDDEYDDDECDDENNHQPSGPYLDDVDEMSPRTGLELHERIHQRQLKNYRDHEDPDASPTASRHATIGNGSTQKLHPMSLSEATQLWDDENINGNDNDNVNVNDCERAGDESTPTPSQAFRDEREEHTGVGYDPDSVISVVWAVKGPAACIFLTFAVTLSLFPSWVSELKSSHECESPFRLDNDLYVPFCFVVYNIGDLLGRLLSGYVPVNRIRHLSRKLVGCALLRVVFVPLFLACNTTTGGDSRWVVRNDFFSLLVQMLFAASNGLLVSTAFMFSPLPVGASPTMQERASKIMSFSISFGLLSGSFLAFPVLELATRMLR